MNGKERLDSLKRQIEASRKTSVSELSETFHVTGETIRRDLDKLEQEGFVTRTHGGVVWNADPLGGGMHFLRRKMKNPEAKREIAGKVYSLLESHKTIAADSSTTVLESLRMLSSKSDLMVLTNSAVVSQDLADASFTILETGGVFNARSLSYQGTLAKENLKRYNVELAVISCKGLMIDQGVMDSYETEAEIKKVMLGQHGK